MVSATLYENGFGSATNVAVEPKTNNARVCRIAFFHGITGLILPIYFLFRANTFDTMMKPLIDANDANKLIVHNLKLGLYTVSGIFALEFVVCVLLVIGVMQAYSKLYIPYLIYTPICRVSVLCVLNVAFIYLPFTTGYIIFMNMIGCLLIGLALYSVSIVYKNYKLLNCSKRESMFGTILY